MSRVNPDERELSDERIRHDLEGECGKWLAVFSFAVQHLLRMIRVCTFSRRNVERRWQIIHHCIEQRLYALILESRSAEYREELKFNHAATQRFAQFLGRNRLSFEELVQHLVIVFGNALHKLRVEGFRFLPQLGGDLFDFVLRTHGFIAPVDRLHVDEIDYTSEIRFLSDGNLNRYRAGIKPFPDGIDGMLEISTHFVHLINETNARDTVLIGLAPYGFRLRLNPMHGVKHSACAVENAQRALDLGRKIHVAGRIDDVDADVAPEACGRGGGNGDAALLLLLHPIHGSGAFVHFADTVRDARIKKDALSRSGLAGIDVGHDADVPATI